MSMSRVGTQPSPIGPAEWFTGTVRIDPQFQPHAPARAIGASVTFEPGARTAWHTHPLGQTLGIWPLESFAPGPLTSQYIKRYQLKINDDYSTFG